MFNKVSKPKLVSTSRANLNNTNLGLFNNTISGL